VSPTDVWAVGQTAPSGGGALIEHWDGHAWTDESLPGVLYSVVETGRNDVWASGRNRLGGWITHWNGHSWTTSPTPKTPKDGLFISLSAVSPKDIWAIGQTTVSGMPLIDHWDGSSWSTVQAVGVPPGGVYRASTATPSGTIWAVGDAGYVNANGSPPVSFGVRFNRVPIVDRIDASGPHPAVLPKFASSRVLLHGVFALSDTDVWAVGYEVFDHTVGATTTETNQPITLHYDGQTWSEIDMAVAQPGFYKPRHVAGVAANDLWAVGDQGANSNDALIEHWDGTRWTLMDTSGTFGRLFGIGASPTVGVLGVGQGAVVLPLCGSRPPATG
jgi:hypothetical protein